MPKPSKTSQAISPFGEAVAAIESQAYTKAEQLMDALPDRAMFTGQVALEINCKAGEIGHVCLITRRTLRRV